MRVSLCKHSFPVLPPHGSLTRPGDCAGCGMTWAQAQEDLRQQEEALIRGSSRDGVCPDCTRERRLYRYQPDEMPWHEIGDELPVTYLCVDCWNGAANAEATFSQAIFDAAFDPTA